VEFSKWLWTTVTVNNVEMRAAKKRVMSYWRVGCMFGEDKKKRSVFQILYTIFFFRQIGGDDLNTFYSFLCGSSNMWDQSPLYKLFVTLA